MTYQNAVSAMKSAATAKEFNDLVHDFENLGN